MVTATPFSIEHHPLGLRHRLLRLLLLGVLYLAVGVPTVRGEQVLSPLLRLGVDAVASTADPHMFNSADSRNLAFHTFEPLIMPDDGLGITPWLAVSWHMEGDHSWIFTLRPGVHFQDGKPLSPHDVAFTFCRVESLGISALAGLVAGVEQATARDPQTLVITTRGPMPLLPHVLTLLAIVPAPAGWKGSYQAGGCADTEAGLADLTEQRFANGQVPGTGPYRLTGFSAGISATLDRMGSYWGTRPHWDTVRLTALANGAVRARALVSADVDIINQVVPETLEFLAARTDIKVADSKPLRTLMLTTSLTGALSDAKVRQAISLAIDRVGLSQRIAQGSAMPADQIAPRDIPGYSPAAALGFDQAEARRLLAQAGVQGDLRLRMITVEPFARVAEGVARYLLAVGIRLDISYVGVGQALPTMRKGNYDLFLGSWVPFTGEMGYSGWELLHSVEPALKAGSQNHNRYSNPEVDRLLSQGMGEMDPGRRAALLQEVSVIASRDLPLIPLLHTTRRWAMHSDIRFDGRVDGNTLATLITPVASPTQ